MTLNDRCFPPSTAYSVRLYDKPIRVRRVDVGAYQINVGYVYVAERRISGIVGRESTIGLDANATMIFENVILRDLWVAVATVGDGVFFIAELVI